MSSQKMTANHPRYSLVNRVGQCLGPVNLILEQRKQFFKLERTCSQLTPSFLGDAPSEWAVNPQLPDGIEMDLKSGVISGIPNYEAPSKKYTIIASNYAGISSFRIEITVLPIPVLSLAMQSSELLCIKGESCHMESPSFSGGEPDKWDSTPPLPSGLILGQDGSISGISDQTGVTNHTITASNNGGSAYATLSINTSHASPESYLLRSRIIHFLNRTTSFPNP